MNNIYEKIPRELLEDEYYNPNLDSGALQHPFRCLIVGGSGSMKTNSAINIIQTSNCFERIYLYAKNLNEPLYKYLAHTMKKIEDKTGEAVFLCSNDLEELPTIQDFDNKKQNLVIIDDMVLEKNQDNVKQILIRGRKDNISLIYISQSYFDTPKLIRLNSDYLVIKNIAATKDLKMILKNHSLDISIEQLVKMYKATQQDSKNCLILDFKTTNPALRFRQNFLGIWTDEK